MPIITFTQNTNYHLLPGRIRITVDGLRRNPCFGEYLIQELQRLDGIRTVSASSLSGRALIHFCPEKMNFRIIQTEIATCRNHFEACYVTELKSEEAAAAVAAEIQRVVPDPGDVTKAPIVAAVLTGGVLGAVLLKRVLVGRSSLAASARVLNTAALVTLISGYPILKDGLEHLSKKKQINSDLLIFAITLILLFMRESITGLSILWLVHLSHLYRHLMQARTHSAIKRMLVDPMYVRLDQNEEMEKIVAGDIRIGDILILGSGETVPVASTIAGGHAQVSEAYITGECVTKEVSDGDTVTAGTYIVSGKVRLKAEEWGNISQTIKIEEAIDRELVDKPLHSVSDYQANKIIPWTVGIAVLVYLMTRDVSRTLAVILAGCPVAISLSRHAALGAAVAAAASKGIYVKDARYLELAGQADTVIFDKTGTLTSNSPEIMELIAIERAFDEDKILEIAASAVQSTMHPVANMLTQEAAKRQLKLKDAEIEPIISQGVMANMEGMRVIVGNELLMNREAIKLSLSKSRAMRMRHLGMSVLYIVVNQKVAGLIGYRDKLKPETLPAISNLRMLGVKRMGLITGDHQYSAGDVSEKLGMNDQWTALSPGDKVQVIKQLRHEQHITLMVGDGINDAPAMAAADIGVAIACAGQNLPLRSADVVIQGNDLSKVPQLIQLSKYTGEVIRQNLGISTGFGLVGVALAAARIISPASAMLLLNFSTLAVLFNSGKVLRYRMKSNKRSAMDLQQFSDIESTFTPSANQHPIDMLLPDDSDPEIQDACLPSADFHLFNIETVCDRLKTSDLGLGKNEVLWRRSKFGLNVLEEGRRPSFWELLLNQFKDFMVQVLLGAAGLSFFLGRSKDALLTLAVVAANALLGVVQERKAESSLNALQKMAAPQAKVVREGQPAKIEAVDLVPGDIIELEAGDRVPADARILSSWQFEVEEASLTGETFPVKKDALFLCDNQTALGDQCNMVFMGTSVTRGRARAIVVATGMQTEMGKVARLIHHNEETITPLQRRLEELGKYLVHGCLAVSGLVFVLGLLRGLAPLYMLQTAAGLAVAAIPEGLSAIVIIALAMGVQRMSKRNIIIRKLSSIETLGCATVICSDKTGTLTKNEMTVRSIYTVGQLWNVSGEGYLPQGEFTCDLQEAEPLADEALNKTLLTGVLCNNSHLVHESFKKGNKVISITEHKTTGWRIEGDPTEGAMLVAAAKNGLNKADLERSYLRLKEIPFEAERRMMSVICANQGIKGVYSKGSVDKILSSCTHYLKGREILPLDDEVIRKINKYNDKMTAQALRVLACAYRPIAINAATDDEALEQNQIFCGLVGMIDPPRPEVPAAVAKCRKAGVKIVMITGDHPSTARTIASDIKLLAANERIITGSDIDGMTDEQLADVVKDVSVYARTSPHHKLRIIKALKSKGYVVAMTGDGVNDAPAVKAADIGIAMGLMGTDVTKEAASMTLADDNFATIVRAMEEGRSIYSNIRKAIRYLVATNIGEVILMLLAILVGLPLPLIPIQLLWINLIGDGLPAIALVNDPPANNIMQEPPKSADDSVFSNGLGRKILTRGFAIGLVSLALFAWKFRLSGNLIAARTLMLAQLAISQFIHIFDCRLEQQAGKQGLFSNRWLVGAVALSMLMVIGIVHIPALQPVFGTMSLTMVEWFIALGVAGVTAILDLGLGNIAKRIWPDRKEPIVPCIPAPMPEVV